jgi:hypothetical protein
LNKKFKKAGFFQDDYCNNSVMRYSCFVSLIASIVFALFVFIGKSTSTNIQITYSFLAAAFGTKVLKKFSD